MIRFALLLILAVSSVEAESLVVPFKQPDHFPLKLRLVAPKTEALVIKHEESNRADSITIHIEDDRQGGLVVEAMNAAGERVWQRDFGYNLSAAPGCSVSVAFHPQLPAVIVGYQGYKADWENVLLFVEKTASAYLVKECPNMESVLLPLIEKQSGYSAQFRYAFSPVRFADRELVFSCIAIDPPERQSVHPFAQDAYWYDVTATLDATFKVTPIQAVISNSP